MAASDLRKNVLDLLRLIASREGQVAYDRDERVAERAWELVCRWFDDLYKPEWPLFQEAFSPEEQRRLAAFNECYDARYKQLPGTVAEMHASPVWQEVMTAAERALQRFGSSEGG